MTDTPDKPKQPIGMFITALAAGIGYGGWAVYANYEHGMDAWMMAGLIQGIYAFFSTLSITYVAKKVFLICNCGIRGISAGFAMSFLVMLAIPFAVHSYFMTPNIWMTILPGLIWGSIYLLGFLISMDVKLRILPNRKLKIEMGEEI